MMAALYVIVLCLISAETIRADGVVQEIINSTDVGGSSSPATPIRRFTINPSSISSSNMSPHDRDTKLMSVLAARRNALVRNRGRRPNNDFNATSNEQLSQRGQCEKNCTNNFTTRATAGCMRKCVAQYKVVLSPSTSNIRTTTNDSLNRNYSLSEYRTKESNSIAGTDELLDTEESQTSGLYYVNHSRNRYAPNVSETKDSNNSIISHKGIYKTNVIDNEVRQTSTEKIYLKLLRTTIDGRQKRIDATRLRQRLPSIITEKSVEDSDLEPYLLFGQKLTSLKVSDSKNLVTPIVSPATKASEEVIYPEVGEFSISKAPTTERNKYRRFNPQTRNIVALSRKYGGAIPRELLDETRNRLNVNKTLKDEQSAIKRSVEGMNMTKSAEEVLNNNSNKSIITQASLKSPIIVSSTLASTISSSKNISDQLNETIVNVPNQKNNVLGMQVNNTTPQTDTVSENKPIQPSVLKEADKLKEINEEISPPSPIITPIQNLISSETVAVTTDTTTDPTLPVNATPATVNLPTIPSVRTVPTQPIAINSTTTPFTSNSPTNITTTSPLPTSTITKPPPLPSSIPTTESPKPVTTLKPTEPLLVKPNINFAAYHPDETPNLIVFLPPKNLTFPHQHSNNDSEEASTSARPNVMAVTPVTSKSFTRTTVSSSVRSTVNPIIPVLVNATDPGSDDTPSDGTFSLSNNITSFNLSSIFPNFSGINSNIPVIPDLSAILSPSPTYSTRKPSAMGDGGILLSPNNDVTIEMHRMNMATYVLAGLGMFPIIIIILYVVRSVLFKKETKSDAELDRYISESHKPISPVVKLEDSCQSSYCGDESIMTEQTFNRSLLKFKNLLGEGNFGQVWKAEADDLAGHIGTTRIVAVKTVRCGNTLSGLKDEADIMRKLGSHPNVVTLLGACLEKEPHLLIMEFAMRGRLLSLLRATKTASGSMSTLTITDRNLTSLSPRRLAGFAHDIARGMEYISEKRIVHRDLAARNVLLDHNGVCKICDFGMSIDLDKSKEQQQQTRKADLYKHHSSPEPHRFRFDFNGRTFGIERKTENCKRPALPIRWMAPEALQYHIFSTETDVWAFGIVLWEIATLGSTPYPELSGREVVRNVPNGTRPEIPIDCRPEMYDLMTRTWCKDPRQRPTFSEARAELARSLCQWEIEDTSSDYLDVSGFSEDLEHGVVYFNRRISEFECEI